MRPRKPRRTRRRFSIPGAAGPRPDTSGRWPATIGEPLCRHGFETNGERGGADPPGVVFFYAPGPGGQNAETFLRGFDGILQLDGYQGYDRLTRPSRKGGDPIRVAHCWAHARRKLKEVFDRDGSELAAVRHCA